MVLNGSQALALLMVWIASTNAVSEVTESEFVRCQRELRPAQGELWRSIPWETSLLLGQAKAARQSKPIFIWAMDGHPLGCT